MTFLTDNNINLSFYQHSLFVHVGQPQDEPNKPYELQEMENIDLSNENSGYSALLEKKALTLVVGACQTAKAASTWRPKRIAMPAEFSPLFLQAKQLLEMDRPSDLRSGVRDLMGNGGDSTARDLNIRSLLHRNVKRFVDTQLDMNSPSGKPCSVGKYLSHADAQNGKARVKLGADGYNQRYSYLAFKARMACYLLLMLFITTTNAIDIPIESPNSIDAGNTFKPTGNQTSSWPSAMDVIAVMAVTALAFLVYLSARRSLHPHIDLGISFLVAFWMHWTVFRGDASQLLIFVVWIYNMGNTLALLSLEVSTLRFGVLYAVAVTLAGTTFDGILTSTVFPTLDVGFIVALPHSIAASMTLTGIAVRLKRLIGDALTQETRNNLEGWFFFAIRLITPQRPSILPH